MDALTVSQAQIIESIKKLPEESLGELVTFVEYLRYKAAEKQPSETGENFLLSIAGIGDSGTNNISDRDEEILANEVHPIHGWSLHSDE